MIRRGTVREDGKLFWSYERKNNKTKEIWVTPQQFKSYVIKRKIYCKKKMQAYRDQQNSLPEDQRNYLGKYNPETGLYFIRVSSSSIVKWATKEEFEKYKIHRRNTKRKRYQVLKNITPAPTVCLGDKHPTDPNLVVVEIRNRKARYGPLEKLQKRRDYIKEVCRKKREQSGAELIHRAKEMRHAKQQFLKENPHLRYHRGDIDPLTGWKFWSYSARGNEVWMPADEFIIRRENFNNQRRKNYLKAKLQGI